MSGQPGNADELEQALVKRRAQLGALSDEGERRRLEAAVESAEHYVALLRAAMQIERPREDQSRPFVFQLELPDGRWQLLEKQLRALPAVGDLVSFDNRGEWRVRSSRLVPTQPARRPARCVLVCAPAA